MMRHTVKSLKFNLKVPLILVLGLVIVKCTKYETYVYK